jgi:hypothetical protein
VELPVLRPIDSEGDHASGTAPSAQVHGRDE